jgi:hypothetical protein
MWENKTIMWNSREDDIERDSRVDMEILRCAPQATGKSIL